MAFMIALLREGYLASVFQIFLFLKSKQCLSFKKNASQNTTKVSPYYNSAMQRNKEFSDESQL